VDTKIWKVSHYAQNLNTSTSKY